MHLKELKKRTPAELVEMAEEFGVEGASTMRRQDLMMSILGTAGLDRDAATADVSTEWLGWIANKIGGGSSEVQLNVVAKRVLELPGA